MKEQIISSVSYRQEEIILNILRLYAPNGIDADLTENVRIRKLTPRECLRLMGWNDEQIDKIAAAKVSATQQYRQAGNGIVVQVLEFIFKALFLGEV